MKQSSGPPTNHPLADARGLVTLPWTMFFQSVQKPAILTGSHADRLSSRFAPENQPAGASFLEADRGAVYFVPDAGPIKTAVDADSAVGTTTLFVASTDKLSAGQAVMVGQGTAREESAVVAAITAGVSLTLATPLEFTHTALQADRVAPSPQWTLMWAEFEAALTEIPTDLGALDKGFVFRATDYDRRWRWTGAAWERAPGELPTLFVGMFCEAPGVGWRLLDGTGNPFTYTKPDGTTGTISIDDAQGSYPRLAAAFTGSQVAAVAPGLSGSAGGSVATGLTVDSGVAALGAPNATQGVQSGGGVTVAAFDHSHTDTGHTHAVTDPGHDHGAGSLAVDDTGEPAHMDFLPFVKL